MKNSITTEIIEWLCGRPKWLQFAAKRLLESGELNEGEIDNFTKLCLDEVDNKFSETNYNIPTRTFNTHNSKGIHLCSIGQIQGVNGLATGISLCFGDSNITIIYGVNGSGKSSYVRLLKHICGTRSSIRGQLHRNVFDTDKNIRQKAQITFYKDNPSVKTVHEWSGENDCDNLDSVDIFDTSFEGVFMGKGEEVSYELPELYIFDKFISICEKVRANLNKKKEGSKMPSIPNDFSDTASANWLKTLNYKTSTADIDTHCSFTLEDEEKSQGIKKRIDTSPKNMIEELSQKKSHTDSIIKSFQTCHNQLSSEQRERIISLKKDTEQKKRTANIAAQEAFSDAQLKEIGSDTWRALWTAARNYSEKLVYKKEKFPVIRKDSVCVLCYQPLSEETRQRFGSFEQYVKGETQKQVEVAIAEEKKAFEGLPDIPNKDTLKTKIDAAGIKDENIIRKLIDAFESFQERKIELESAPPEDNLKNVELSILKIEEIQNISKAYDEEIKEYQAYEANDNTEELKNELKNLSARKWLYDQKCAIQKEVILKKDIERIDNAIKKTNTTDLSKKKKKLVEKYITEKFKERFAKELKSLKYQGPRINIQPQQASKGKIYHAFQLDETFHKNLNDILSEGERRIVSIAAFLADIAGENNLAPFVFDDPISSLDQRYEEAVAKRLCELALERQVIVFTHRIPFLVGIYNAEKNGIDPEIINIQKQNGRTGYPGKLPHKASPSKKALSRYISEEIPKAKKLYNEPDKKAYEEHAEFLCKRFRELVESVIEHELLSSIVLRFSPNITTKGKIHHLAEISEADCNQFDDWMTRYSSYVHDPSDETPLDVPPPEEIEEDFEKLRIWMKEFRKRKDEGRK